METDSLPPPPETTGRLKWRRDLAVAAALALLALAVFGQAVSFGPLMMDENALVWNNPGVQHGLTPAGIKFALTGFSMGMWMPVTHFTHLVDVSLFGNSPWGHHAGSLLWHLATTALLYLALLRLTGRPFESGLATALFAVHPMRAEAVAWIGSRRELPCAFFYVLSVYFYARHAERPGWRRMAWVAAAMALANMSKPMAVTIPCALLLLDYWPLNRLSLVEWRRAPRLVLEKLPLSALSGVSAWLGYIGQRSVPSTVDLDDQLTLAFRVGNAVLSYGRYLWHTLCPLRLSGHYPELREGLPLFWVAVSALVLAALTLLALWSRKEYALMGWAWFLGTLVPVIGVVGFGNAAMADRWTYIPHMGLMMAVAWAWSGVAGAWPGNVAAENTGKGKKTPKKPRMETPPSTRLRNGVAAGAVLLYAVLGLWQTAYWRDDETLNRRMLAVSGGTNAMAHANLGYLRGQEGQAAQALAHYREAARLEPHNPIWASNLALFLNQLNRYRETEAFLAPLLEKHAINPHIWMQYGIALLEQGRPAEALPHMERAVGMQPRNFMFHTNLGVCLNLLGEREKAEAAFRKALELEPRYRPAQDGLAGLAPARE